MSNKKIVFASIMGTILATSLLALNPSTITSAGAQMYGDQYGYDSNYYQDDNRYGYDNNHQKKSSHTDIQKIECVNSNINVNDVDITQILEDDTATTAATNEQAGPEGANAQNENGFDKINFDRDLVICVNDNAIEQVKVTPPPTVELATLSVSKTVSCKTLTQNNELQLVCNAILGSFPQSTITPDEFTIHVTGNNPIPPSFDGSTTPVLVTLGPGDYEVTETAKASVQATVDLINTVVPTIVVTGPTPTFSGDCEQDQMDPEKATGTIAEGDSKTCNKNNEFQVDFRPS